MVRIRSGHRMSYRSTRQKRWNPVPIWIYDGTCRSSWIHWHSAQSANPSKELARNGTREETETLFTWVRIRWKYRNIILCQLTFFPLLIMRITLPGSTSTMFTSPLPLDSKPSVNGEDGASLRVLRLITARGMRDRAPLRGTDDASDRPDWSSSVSVSAIADARWELCAWSLFSNSAIRFYRK